MITVLLVELCPPLLYPKADAVPANFKERRQRRRVRCLTFGLRPRQATATMLWDTTDVPLEVLELEPMASGERSLLLSTRVSWEDFASYAPRVVALLGGRIIDRADSAPERVWAAIIDGQHFWISFDDFALGVSLDPQDHAAGELIPTIREKLLQRRAG